MSLKKVSLRKLLLLFYGPENLRIRTLRDDIRRDINKALGDDSEGGDFFVPFWADAKAHMFGGADLHESTLSRIEKNGRRKRLYEAAEAGFLSWWNEKRRWRNEPIEPTSLPTKATILFDRLGGQVKVDNVFALNSGSNFHRLIYPYFSEKPAITSEAARLGLWALTESLGKHHDPNSMRILDVQRGTSIGIVDEPLHGNESELFETKYTKLLQEWEKLRKEY